MQAYEETHAHDNIDHATYAEPENATTSNAESSSDPTDVAIVSELM